MSLMASSVVIHSDSGTYSTLFAKAAGIIASLAPEAEIVDACQEFEQGNIRQISAYLFTSVPFWPDGTIFLSLAGEGEPIVVRLASGSYIISPNNGTATMCVKSFGVESVRFIDTEKYGRDEWALVRCAAALAAGEDFDNIGKPTSQEETVYYDLPVSVIGDGYAEGEVGMLLMTFGNITFSIGTDEFEDTGIRTGDIVRVTFTRNGVIEWQADVPYQPSFGYVPEGDPVVFNGSSGYMDIGLNKKNFIKRCIPQILDADDPGEFKVRIEKIGGKQ